VLIEEVSGEPACGCRRPLLLTEASPLLHSCRAAKERIYIGKGRYVEDDPTLYPGREANNAAGGWAGGEKALWALREELKSSQPPAAAQNASPKPAKPRSPSVTADLQKDTFGIGVPLAGGFPGGEVGLNQYNATGEVAPRKVASLGIPGWLALLLAVTYASGVALTDEYNPLAWQVVVGDAPSAAPAAERKAAATIRLPAVDTAVVKTVAPPAAAVGGVVLAGLGLQAAFRALLDSLSRAALFALFASVVAAAAARILNLI
jgi:hypothetical protein